MSDTFTCKGRFDCQHLTRPQYIHMHMHIPSPSAFHSSPTPCSDSGVALSSCKTVIDDTTVSLTPCLTTISDTKTFYSAIEVTSLVMETEETDNLPHRPRTPTSTAAASPDGMDEVQAEKASTHRTPPSKRKKSGSRASSTSQHAPRSASSSTAGRAPRGSSVPLAGKAATPMSQKKRDDLLALHRDSCRLFQENGLTSAHIASDAVPQRDGPVRSYTAPAHPVTRGSYVSARISSPTVSPTVRSQRSPPFFAADQDGDVSDDELLSRKTSLDQQPYVPVPATVIDWTSPSTRRREYEKIDRSNRGIRRVWRRLAPKCLQSSDRMPFFEEGKDGKGNYEGSVRRFRMDIPDEKEERDELAGVSKKTDIRGKWSCFAS